jgi:hypothetical protein
MRGGPTLPRVAKDRVRPIEQSAPREEHSGSNRQCHPGREPAARRGVLPPASKEQARLGLAPASLAIYGHRPFRPDSPSHSIRPRGCRKLSGERGSNARNTKFSGSSTRVGFIGEYDAEARMNSDSTSISLPRRAKTRHQGHSNGVLISEFLTAGASNKGVVIKIASALVGASVLMVS